MWPQCYATGTKTSTSFWNIFIICSMYWVLVTNDTFIHTHYFSLCGFILGFTVWLSIPCQTVTVWWYEFTVLEKTVWAVDRFKEQHTSRASQLHTHSWPLTPLNIQDVLNNRDYLVSWSKFWISDFYLDSPQQFLEIIWNIICSSWTEQ